MTTKIEKKIVGYRVASPESDATKAATEVTNRPADVIQMHESLERPEFLIGSTYKIKPPETASAHALYITINDIILNEGTEHEQRRPFEVFINSKGMEHFQWIVALTRIISAVFRKGGDVTFLVEELRSVFDPNGGYYKKGGVFMPSLVAEIGDVIERHMVEIGMIKRPVLDKHQKKLIDEKLSEFQLTASPSEKHKEPHGEMMFPESAELCKKCSTKAVILMDGCMTCLNCGDSKCG
ncbi:MAG: NrdJb [Pseudomonadota bacterium]